MSFLFQAKKKNILKHYFYWRQTIFFFIVSMEISTKFVCFFFFLMFSICLTENWPKECLVFINNYLKKKKSKLYLKSILVYSIEQNSSVLTNLIKIMYNKSSNHHHHALWIFYSIISQMLVFFFLFLEENELQFIFYFFFSFSKQWNFNFKVFNTRE